MGQVYLQSSRDFGRRPNLADRLSVVGRGLGLTLRRSKAEALNLIFGDLGCILSTFFVFFRVSNAVVPNEKALI